MKLFDVSDVSLWRLCVGCGACAWACPKGNISLIDLENQGIRPIIGRDDCQKCGECLKVCPGLGITRATLGMGNAEDKENKSNWGPFLEVWEGFATDTEIRFRGSSGGLATALAAYCLENKEAGQVVHTAKNDHWPWKNKTVVSRNRKELLRGAGSRYSPASPCEGFNDIEESKGLSVFIGKPCDMEALDKSRAIRPNLQEKVAVAIGIFCAGTPSTRATVDLIKEYGLDLNNVTDLRYRGNGWPGHFSVFLRNENNPAVRISYLEAWRNLQKYRPYRCYLCPDGTSEFADISCGDAWHKKIEEGGEGMSLVLVRTEKGRKILQGAMEAGYITVKNVVASVIEKAQPGFQAKRGAIWGRLLAMKSFRIPTPKYEGFYLYESWGGLPFKEKGRSILGTVKRIIERSYYRPEKSQP